MVEWKEARLGSLIDLQLLLLPGQSSRIKINLILIALSWATLKWNSLC